MSLADVLDRARRQPQERIVAVGASAAVGLALLAACSLSLAVHPTDLAQRLDSLSAQLLKVEALRARPGDPHAIAPGALCARPLLNEAAILHDELEQDSRTLRLAQAHVDAQPDISGVPGAVQPVKFSVDAAGDYASAVRLLQMLDHHRPAILVDRLDLTSRTTFLRLHLGGRVMCLPLSQG